MLLFPALGSSPPTHLPDGAPVSTELHVVAWAVRLAVYLCMSYVTVCIDSEVAIAQVLSLRTCSHVQHQ